MQYRLPPVSFGPSLGEAFRFLSNHLAVLKAFPYHSREFPLRNLVENQLPSVQAIRRYLHQVLVPQAQAGHKLIVALRANWPWGFGHTPIQRAPISSRKVHTELQTPSN